MDGDGSFYIIKVKKEEVWCQILKFFLKKRR
jgi:hypothetical protein